MQTQQFLTITALVLFTTFLLTFNRSLLSHYSVSNYNESVIVATGLAQSLIDEIYGRSFDEATVSAPAASTNLLAAPSNLGMDGGEGAVTTFDDIDDFNGYKKEFKDKKLGLFTADVKIFYVNHSDINTKVNTQTFLKRVDVSIVNTYLALEENNSQDTLKFFTTIGY